MTEIERIYALKRFEEGNAPEDAESAVRLMTGVQVLADFWEKMYLREYIAPGGSKVKFVTGRRGSGVTICNRQERLRRYVFSESDGGTGCKGELCKGFLFRQGCLASRFQRNLPGNFPAVRTGQLPARMRG